MPDPTPPDPTPPDPTPPDPTSRAPRTLVVSLRKSGTHLIREVALNLGYALYGEVFATPGDQPLLQPPQVWRVLRSVYPPQELDALTHSDDKPAIAEAMRTALAALNEVWRERLAVPWTGGLATPPAVRRLAAQVRSRAERLSFSDLPENSCWILHQLPLAQVAPDFLRDWARTGAPRIILNHRDPRDVLLSMVTFLSEDSGRGIGGFADHQMYAEILRATGSIEHRLTIALEDPHFPGATAFEDAVWLLRHPRVCRVSFEDLVGEQGGGSRQRQEDAVARIAGHLNAEADPRAVAEKIFNRGSFTFRAGRIGRWQEHFTPRHRELFEARYGNLLDLYGYR
jgi:hypothetical protein